MNQFIIVGNIVDKGKLKKTKTSTSLKLIVEEEKTLKNSKGKYDKQSFDIILEKKLAEECVDKIKKDSYIAVKGHLDSDKEGLHLIADKVVFAYDL